jgi:hypothetical protein
MEAQTMSAKTAERMAEETRETRLAMRALTKVQGLTENEALAKVLPNDRNRTKKLKRWKENGLWPVSESELLEHAEPPGDDVIQDSEPKTTLQAESVSQSNVNSDIQRDSVITDEADLLKRIRAMLDTIKAAERPVGATAKGRMSPLQTRMIAIRIPESLDDELKALGDLKSRHIEKAIMLYLRAMKAGDSGDEQA